MKPALPRLKRTRVSAPARSALERKFALLWKSLNGPALILEHAFAPPRRWRFDFAHPATRVAIEVQGGSWSNGRHCRGAGMAADAEKLNAAAIQGWSVFLLTREMLNIPWLETVRDVIEGRMAAPAPAGLVDGDARFLQQARSLLADPVNARLAATFRAGLFALGYDIARGGATTWAKDDHA